MTTPALSEADSLAEEFQASLNQFGVATIALALALWRRVPARQASDGVAEEWLDRAVRLVLERRLVARDFAVSYYRLNRALRTGHTIPHPRKPTPATVTLGSLWDDYAQMLRQTAESDSEPRSRGSRTNPLTPIIVEPLERLSDRGDEDEAEIEEAAELQARIVLKALGPDGLRRRLDEINTTRDAETVDAQRDEAHAKSGSRQAAAIERLVLNGGRSAVWSLADRDKRVIGMVRASVLGTTSAWCSALMAQGPTFDVEGDQYHDNCHCLAFPLYSPGEHTNSPRFTSNREYAELWPRVTRGLSGEAALSAWRKYIRRQRKPNRQAQVA